jgi:hypothetical protein
MTYRKTLMLGCFIVSSLTLFAAPALASKDDEHGSTIVCKSRNFNANFCPFDTRGGVQLIEQRSRAKCILGTSWSFDRQGIYVRDGCEGVFFAKSRGGGRDWRDRGNDWDRGFDRGRGYDQGYDDDRRRAGEQRAFAACALRAREEAFARGARNFEVLNFGQEVNRLGNKGFIIRLNVKSNPRGFFQTNGVNCYIDDGVVVRFRVS